MNSSENPESSDPVDAHPFHVGTTISGRYHVERPIGEGAMGAVALARHVNLDEPVAIKFLRPALRRDPEATARLSREAKALARIKSDHVARVLDVGATLAVGPYLVMEYLEGEDMGELLERDGPLPVARAIECVLQLCEALAAAHAAGIVHRDIKPQNLFWARHGRFETLKVLDFGICKGVPTRDGRPDLEVEPYGTPCYMSPERVANEPGADHRADIWSVGVVLHELITGRPVFEGDSVIDVCARILAPGPLPLEPDETRLPSGVRAVILRCLERDPARRYQSSDEVTAALVPLARMSAGAAGATPRRQGPSSAPRSRPSSLPAASAQSPVSRAQSSTMPVRARSSTPPVTLHALPAERPSALSRMARPRYLVLGIAGAIALASALRGLAGAPPSLAARAPAPQQASAAAAPLPSAPAVSTLAAPVVAAPVIAAPAVAAAPFSSRPEPAAPASQPEPASAEPSEPAGLLEEARLAPDPLPAPLEVSQLPLEREHRSAKWRAKQRKARALRKARAARLERQAAAADAEPGATDSLRLLDERQSVNEAGDKRHERRHPR